MSSTQEKFLPINRYHLEHADKEHIEVIVETCKQIFNDAFGSNFLNSENLKVEFFNLENGVTVYEKFCKQFFPTHLAEDYARDGYMESFVAQAFVNRDVYGILIRLDSHATSDEWYQIILHEMSHIFCIVHEIGGEDFFQKYCTDDKESAVQKGIIGAGYTVWREFIADDIAAQVNPLLGPLSMFQIRGEIRKLDEEVDVSNPVAKMIVSQMLACIFRNVKIRQSESAATVSELLEKNRVFASKARNCYYHELIEVIFEQLLRDDYWKISLEFIEDLGSAYLGMLARRYAQSYSI